MTFGRYTAADGQTIYPQPFDPGTGQVAGEVRGLPTTVFSPSALDNQRMRVLHITPYIIAGGVESWIRTLARSQRGIVRHAVAAPWAGCSGLQMMSDVDLYRPAQNLDPYSAQAREWLAGLLAAHPEFGVLHCTYHKGLYEAALADGRPRMVTVHSAGYEWLHHVQSPTLAVTISEWQEALLPPWVQAKSVLIRNGIEVERFARPPGGADDVRAYRDVFTRGREKERGAVVALWVGRLHETKGIEVLRAVGDRWLAEGAKRYLVVIGQAHDPAVEREMRHWGRGQARVSMLSYVEPEEMPWVYAAADVYLHTAPCEGFGLTVAEAQAAGLPVVAYNVPGVNEIVVGGETGLLASDDRPGIEMSHLVACLERLTTDQRLRRRMGKAGQRRVGELFMAERMGAEYLQVYRRCLR